MVFNTDDESEDIEVMVDGEGNIIHPHTIAEGNKLSNKDLLEYYQRAEELNEDKPYDKAFIPTKATVLLGLSLVGVWLSFHIAAMFTGQSYINYVFQFGLVPAQSPTFEYFTAIFVHGNSIHLFVNFLALISFGGLLHRHLGSTKKYLIYFLVAGLVTMYAQVLAFSYVGMNPEVPLVGASGAICALLGYFGFAKPNKSVDLFFIFRVKAKNAVMGFFLVSLAVISYYGMGAGGFAHTAHIVGLVIGMLTAVRMGQIPRKLPLVDSNPLEPFKAIIRDFILFGKYLMSKIKGVCVWVVAKSQNSNN